MDWDRDRSRDSYMNGNRDRAQDRSRDRDGR
jgi:hypothetical protein